MPGELRLAVDSPAPPWPEAASSATTGFFRRTPASVNAWNVTRRSRAERVFCLDEKTGKLLWQHVYPCRYQVSYPSGPRATPTVSDGRVYTVGAMGDLVCLAAADGRVLWSKNYVRDFGTVINPWGMASAPLVDGQRLIVLAGGAGGACVVALDLRSGEEVWRSLDAEDPGYARRSSSGRRPPTDCLELAGRPFARLPPRASPTGNSPTRPRWPMRSPRPSSIPSGDCCLSPRFRWSADVALAPGGPAAELLWQGFSRSELPRNTDKLHCLMSTPAVFADHLFGVDSYGHLRCLDLDTGERLWETLEATGENRWANAFLIRHGDRFFLFNEHGELVPRGSAPPDTTKSAA